MVGLALFLNALLVAPALDVPSSLRDLKRQIRAQAMRARAPAETHSDKVLARFRAGRKDTPATAHRPGGPEIRAAFFCGWDAASIQSLKKHGDEITHLCPEWLSFTDFEKGIIEDPGAELEKIPLQRNFALMPVLNNLAGDRRVPEGVETLMRAEPAAKAAFISGLAARLKDVGARGVVIDWDEVDSGDDGALSRLVCEIADGLKKDGLETWLCVPMGTGFAAWDFDLLPSHVNRFVGMLHDETGEGDPPGPLASQDWFDGWMEVINHCGEPGQWIASLGSYGSDWKEGAAIGEQISFADVMSRAGNAGCADVKNSGPDFNGRFSYYYEGAAHDVWFLDAASFANQWQSVCAYGLGGIAVNRLGLEDPEIWSVVGSGARPVKLSVSMPGGTAITAIGDGEVVSLDTTSSAGRRAFSTDNEGHVSCNYESFPAHPTLFRQGAGEPENVCLTFDDGPDPEWTPKILDILKSEGVKAAFFVVGEEAERYPEIVKRIVDEGHEIGNHSFTHPNLAEESVTVIRLELNATQRLIESLTGRSTVLFRPPYNADSRPSALEELVPINVAQSLGYTTVLETIDPRDWDNPGAEHLLELVKSGRGDGNVILLHDGGGDREATVAALPALIAYLKERGDRIVRIGDLLGIPEDKIMPALTADKRNFHSLASGIGFQILHVFQEFVRAFLVVGTALVVLRTIIILVLARLHKPPGTRDLVPAPRVSVLVPAYNEEKVIAKTLGAILASDYNGEFEVVVVDDGSSDKTADVVAGIGDPRVRLVRQKNSGKAHALQRGIDETSSEILVFADADTQFERDAIRRLVAAFADSKVGAVSGHARVGNLRTFLARCQDLEYVSGFNLDRRAYAAWNCITVAPGAISAVKRTAIEAAGGFSYETLAEDTDLTLSIHRAGFRVEYQPGAIAYTEAPETFSALARQRFRWAFGTLQCVFKHRDLVFNPRYKALGWFSLPGIWFFQVLLVALSPFIDILFLQSLLFGHAGDILPYFLAFIACDLVVAGIAVRMEGLPLKDALRVIPQRFLYRPLLSYVVWKSIVHALRGAWVGWGKLHRTATVSLP